MNEQEVVGVIEDAAAGRRNRIIADANSVRRR